MLFTNAKCAVEVHWETWYLKWALRDTYGERFLLYQPNAMPIPSEEFIWNWACSKYENLAVVLSAPLVLCRFEVIGTCTCCMYWTTLPIVTKNMFKAIKHRNVGDDTKEKRSSLFIFQFFRDLTSVPNKDLGYSSNRKPNKITNLRRWYFILPGEAIYTSNKKEFCNSQTANPPPPPHPT